jgi:iron(III) transport system substrate-binding protein
MFFIITILNFGAVMNTSSVTSKHIFKTLTLLLLCGLAAKGVLMVESARATSAPTVEELAAIEEPLIDEENEADAAADETLQAVIDVVDAERAPEVLPAADVVDVVPDAQAETPADDEVEATLPDFAQDVEKTEVTTDVKVDVGTDSAAEAVNPVSADVAPAEGAEEKDPEPAPEPEPEVVEAKEPPAPVFKGEVNVYSSRKEGLVKGLFDKFTEQTQIKVNFVTDKAKKLISRLQAEGSSSPADVFLTSDVGNLGYAAEQGLLQAVNSSTLNTNVPAKYRDAGNKWFGLSQRVRALFYAKDRVKARDLSSYEALALPEWKGRVVVRSSSNVYNQSLLASILEANGQVLTEAWTEGLVRNFARKPQGGDRDQIKAVASGEADVAIANSYYYARMLNSDDADEKAAAQKVAIFFPNQNGRGTHANISGGGVLTSAKNRDHAIALLEYLSGKEAQKIYADVNHEYPVAQGVALSDTVAAWGDFKRDALPLSALTKYRKEVVKIADRAGWR